MAVRSLQTVSKNGIAAVDDKHQTIIWAEAFGDANESGHLPEILEGIEVNCQKAEIDSTIYKTTKVTADSGFHNEKSMEEIHEKQIDAIIADNQFRRMDFILHRPECWEATKTLSAIIFAE